MNNRKHRQSVEHYLRGKRSRTGKRMFDAWFNAKEDEEAFEATYSAEERAAMQQKGLAQILSSQVTQPVSQTVKVRPLWATTGFRIAAACASFLLVAATVGWFIWSGRLRETTAYGETKTVQLPDGSTVTLNGNSSLTYWAGGKDDVRHVTLDGEAYFRVVHTQNHRPFRVATARGLMVEVLGTEFNVSSRPRETSVVLSSGSIRLTAADRPDTLVLRPGDRVGMRAAGEKLAAERVNPHLYTSWKERELRFDKTPLGEVIHLLEDTYGLQVSIQDSTLLEQQISGSVPSHNVQLLLKGLAETCHLNISHTQNHVVLEAP